MNRQTKGILYVLISAVLFSMGGLCVKMVPWSPLTINGVRNLIALLVFGIYLKVTHHKLVINKAVLFGAVCMASTTTPLGGTRRVGGLLGVAGRLSGTVSPFRAEQGTSLRRRRGQGPHLAKRWEPRGFSRVAAAFSTYDGDLSLPLGLALGSPIFPSGCEGKLGVALESLQGLRDLT